MAIMQPPEPFVAQQFDVPQWQAQQQFMPQQAQQFMPQQAPQQAPQGLLAQIGSGIKDRVQDPNFMDRLAIGLSGMSMHPNQGLIETSANRIDQRQKLGMANATARSVVAKLRADGNNQMADIIEQNPSMASAYLNEMIKSQLRPELKKDTSPLQYDPFTGQAFYVQIGQDGKPQRIDVEGAIGETPQQKTEREIKGKLEESDLKLAQEKAAIVFGSAQNIDSQLAKLSRIKDLALKEGANTGIISNLFPAFDAATAELRGLANSLGIDIINSATFGALSEKELTLALSTGFDRSLQGQELIDYINNKMSAQMKLRNQLMADARDLSNGRGYKSYILSRTGSQRETEIPNYSTLSDEEMINKYKTE